MDDELVIPRRHLNYPLEKVSQDRVRGLIGKYGILCWIERD